MLGTELVAFWIGHDAPVIMLRQHRSVQPQEFV
jgi:hypothetical protein